MDFDLHADVKDLVTNFVASPEGRTKDIIPNLYTLIGYIVALPPETTKEIFCLGGKETNQTQSIYSNGVGTLKFWPPVVVVFLMHHHIYTETPIHIFLPQRRS